MHLLILLLAFGMAWLLRLSWAVIPHSPKGSGSTGLVILIAPSLFILMTCVSIVWMGPFGMGLPLWEGWLSYGAALAFLIYAIAVGVKLITQNHRFIRHIQTLPKEIIQGYPCRVLDTQSFYSAQCGWGATELVVSRGLLNHLSDEQIEAVLAHEEGHKHFNDLQQSAILSWFKQVLPLFPYADAIWKYLIIVRELRADRWATQSIDPITLAEALVSVAQAPQLKLSASDALLTGDQTQSGLSIRVKALIEPDSLPQSSTSFGTWLWLIVACCPLLMVPFHH